MAIDRAEVRRISELARLELDDAAIDSLTVDLESILGYVALLDELDVSRVDPTACAVETPREPREDSPGGSLDTDLALSNAPEAADGHFRVPQVIAE